MLVGGEIELGVQQIPELMSVNGAEIIAVFLTVCALHRQRLLP